MHSHARVSIRPATLLGTAAILAVVGVSRPAGAGTPTYSPFTEEAVARGVVYQVQAWGFGSDGYLGYGCGFADLDTDGDPDLVILGSADGRVGIFENDGTGNFTDHTPTSGIPLLAEASAFSAGDYDGDGDLDLYLTQVGQGTSAGRNVLARNDGGFRFTDVANAAGVDDSGASKGASFGDFDNDGWIDLYVCNYEGQQPGVDNKLFRNRGDGTFEDVSFSIMHQDISAPGSHAFQTVWFDYDRDGDVDLYLSTDRGHLDIYPPIGQFDNPSNQLWRNDGGQLTNVSAGSGADLRLFSMGVACGDFNGDQWADLYTTNIPGGGGMNNPLMLNHIGLNFVENAVTVGVDNPFTSWGAIFFDADNDTSYELYVNNQWCPNSFYKNVGGYPCEELAAEFGLEGTPTNDMDGDDCDSGNHAGVTEGLSFSSAVADVDGDGDLDLIENNTGLNAQLYINNEGSSRRWLKLRMIGEGPNHFAVGGLVEVQSPNKTQFREVLAGGNGYLGQNELTLHFGMDFELNAQTVIAQWPGGSPVRTLGPLSLSKEWLLIPPSRLGDGDLDGDKDLDDFVRFAGCFAAPSFEPGCEAMDFDGDSDVDGDDYTSFLGVYAGPSDDCNANMVSDLDDIINGTSVDGNGNGRPDECDTVGDATGDGLVNIDDIVAIVLAFGPCPGGQATCPADVNFDLTVNIDDIVVAVLNWTR
jgi:hypothetical protein